MSLEFIGKFEEVTSQLEDATPLVIVSAGAVGYFLCRKLGSRHFPPKIRQNRPDLQRRVGPAPLLLSSPTPPPPPPPPLLPPLSLLVDKEEHGKNKPRSRR